MVKGLQTSFLRKRRRCQQIKACLGFTVQGLGIAWIFFSLAVSVLMARDCMSRSSIVRLTPAPSPTRAVARRMRRKFYHSLRLLLVSTLVREIIIFFGIYMSFSTPSIYLYKATIKKYILHLYKATNSSRDKSYYSLLSS